VPSLGDRLRSTTVRRTPPPKCQRTRNDRRLRDTRGRERGLRARKEQGIGHANRPRRRHLNAPLASSRGRPRHWPRTRDPTPAAVEAEPSESALALDQGRGDLDPGRTSAPHAGNRTRRNTQVRHHISPACVFDAPRSPIVPTTTVKLHSRMLAQPSRDQLEAGKRVELIAARPLPAAAAREGVHDEEGHATPVFCFKEERWERPAGGIPFARVRVERVLNGGSRTSEGEVAVRLNDHERRGPSLVPELDTLHREAELARRSREARTELSSRDIAGWTGRAYSLDAHKTREPRSAHAARVSHSVCIRNHPLRAAKRRGDPAVQDRTATPTSCDDKHRKGYSEKRRIAPHHSRYTSRGGDCPGTPVAGPGTMVIGEA
jgi:hypothetical protein